jgi:hypothetical protein
LNATFQILHGDVPAERQSWLDLWTEWPRREAFAHPSFVESFLAPGQQSLCAVQRTEAGAVLLPLILRPLANESWSGDSHAWDATTPYGYGGAYAWGNVDADAFWDDVDAWAAQERVVSLFARLSLFSDMILPFRGEVTTAQDNIVRSLELDDEAMLMDYEHKVRKNIKKAQRNGLTVEWDLRGERLAEFHAIYISTMVRREATGGYFFPIEFFQKLIDECPTEVAFVHAYREGRIVSTELVLVGAEVTYSFLGGTDAESFDLRPNDLLKHEIIRWSREQGKRYFVLGGGYTPDDGIFRYKKSFAPNDGTRPFFVGRRTYDEAASQALVERRKQAQPGWEPAEGFFPAYRAPGKAV